MDTVNAYLYNMVIYNRVTIGESHSTLYTDSVLIAALLPFIYVKANVSYFIGNAILLSAYWLTSCYKYHSLI